MNPHAAQHSIAPPAPASVARRALYRDGLPQLGERVFLTDGGLETTLIYHEGLALPAFAAFDLLRSESGCAALERYFERYVAIARQQRCGIVLETPTWRASRDWALSLGYDAESLRAIQLRSVEMLLDLRARLASPQSPIVISGNVGPRGDGYRAAMRMSIGEARDYHFEQIAAFADSAADLIGAFTLNYAEEAIGIALAAQACEMPLALAFTVETDGRLPSGEALAAALQRVEQATAGYPAYYMINCAHPSHFEPALQTLGALRDRIRGLRANASTRSHAELDVATELDSGDPRALALDYRRLRGELPRLTVVGGCCGTDHRHVAQIGAELCAP